MVRYDIRTLSLTTGASGAAGVGTTQSISGKLVRVTTLCVTASVTASWVLGITEEVMGIEHTIFTDADRSNSTTAADVSYPVVPAAKTADGTASSLTELGTPITGPITVSVGTAGNSKNIKVELVFEVA